MHKGSCLCGGVRIEATGDLVPPDACHCSWCRKQSGHFWVSTYIPQDSMTIAGEERVRWYRSSEEGARGFCSTCGSFLFWNPVEGDHIAISMGVFETPTQTQLARHLYVADQGDYYEIADGLPQRAQ